MNTEELRVDQATSHILTEVKIEGVDHPLLVGDRLFLAVGGAAAVTDRRGGVGNGSAPALGTRLGVGGR